MPVDRNKHPRRVWFSLIAASVAALVHFSSSAAELPPPASQKVDFLKDIQPILTNSCYECHAAEKQKGGLRLDLKALALKGGDTGPLLVPGKSADSLIIQVVTGTKEDIARMPKKKDPLTDTQIGSLRA